MTKTHNADQVAKLRELIGDMKFCMLTTVEPDGSLHSRPMAVQQTEFDGDLWFFTGKSTEKVQELAREQRVNVSFSDPKENTYVSVSGTARMVQDAAKAKELWNPFYRTWFPKGLDDPDLTLLKVDVDHAEYWDAPNSLVTHLFGVVQATVTGKRPSPGDHAEVTLNR